MAASFGRAKINQKILTDAKRIYRLLLSQTTNFLIF
jgi:hypothetical protein